MKIITRPLRLARIIFIMMRYNVDEIVLGRHWFFPLRLVVYLNPFYWTTGRKLPRGVRIRLATEKLGPIFVKAGQIISTRRDLLPDDVTSELAKLQDRVAPFAGKKAKSIIEKAQGCRVSEVFKEFDINALASASIAQVHAATLLSGESVVVKVLRPNVHDMIDRDVDLLMTLAKIADRYWYTARHFKPKQIVNEVAQTLYDELDLMREGSNASQLRRNFKDSDLLHVPQIYWRQSNAKMLVMERIHGIPVHDVERLKAAGVNMKKLAEHESIRTHYKYQYQCATCNTCTYKGGTSIPPTELQGPLIKGAQDLKTNENSTNNYAGQTINSTPAVDYNYSNLLPCKLSPDKYSTTELANAETTAELPTYNPDINQTQPLPPGGDGTSYKINYDTVGVSGVVRVAKPDDQCYVRSVVMCGTAQCTGVSQQVTKSIGAVCPDGYAQVGSFDVQPEVNYFPNPQVHYPITVKADYDEYSASYGYTCTFVEEDLTNNTVKSNVCDTATTHGNDHGNPWGTTFDTVEMKSGYVGGVQGNYVGRLRDDTDYDKCYYTSSGLSDCQNEVDYSVNIPNYGCPNANDTNSSIYERYYTFVNTFAKCTRPPGTYVTTHSAPRALVCARIKADWKQTN